ncbi:MAG TPA: DNA-formamidopyrimidine glycosylase family protein [Gemmatimonadaceae bacterium]
MPELPDITVYVDALRRRVVGQPLAEVRLKTPFLLRTVEPPLADLIGKHVIAVERLGKRIVLEMDGELFVVIHLMIAGRLHWKVRGAKSGGRSDLAAFEFPTGILSLTEAGTKRRASLHLVRGRTGLAEFRRGGLEPLEATLDDFAARLRSENHTVKRSLTDPRLFSGIGNAYSDEILHAAKLSPMKLTRSLADAEIARLHAATRDTLLAWIDRLRADAAGRFPEKVTAFREEMAVHGRFKQPCPVCGAPIQRIVYAENECNYCARCQTGGRLLADRSLSRLLKDDWPKSIDDL